MKRLLGDIRRADEDFHMIARGDRVAVGVSGGKDSLMLLRALAVYSRFAVKPFEVVAITLKTGDPFDVAPIRALCEELNVPYVVEECATQALRMKLSKMAKPLRRTRASRPRPSCAPPVISRWRTTAACP